jgi:hypothetical protein
MLAVVASGQTVEALLLTSAPLQLSLPLATTVLVTAQATGGAVHVPVKLALTPGARLATVNTSIPGAGSVLCTITLFNVMLPELLTVPV